MTSEREPTYLKTLDDRVLTWPQLNEWLAEYYARKAVAPVFIEYPRRRVDYADRSYRCNNYRHTRCQGRKANPYGFSPELVACGCPCHVRSQRP